MPSAVTQVGVIEASMALHVTLGRLRHRLSHRARQDVERAQHLASLLTMAHLRDVEFVDPLERLELTAELAMRSGIGMDDIAAVMTRVALRRGVAS
ncbi:MAG: hypothetical protein HQL45_14180 [Alphaproteobacteria bacterium]|nr:hypothetical protein [Alphaproteobacteria bacterium]